MSREDWVMITKRTNDPKLSHFARLLTMSGIVSMRDGESFHAPILRVKRQDEEKAWAILTGDFGDGRVYDEIPDDDPMFGGEEVDEDDEYEDDEYEDDTPQGMGWVGSDGLP